MRLKILAAPVLAIALAGSGCSMFDIPPEIEARLSAVQDQVRSNTLQRDAILAQMKSMDPGTEQYKVFEDKLAELNSRLNEAPHEIANIRAALETHREEVKDRFLGMIETGVSTAGPPISAAFPAAAPIIGLIGGIIGSLRRRKTNGS